MWDKVAGKVRMVCREVLGVVKGGKVRVNKETWWWEGDVQDAVRRKKQALGDWQQGKTEELLKAYRQCKRDAKREVAKVKARRYEDMYERLDTKEGKEKCTSWQNNVRGVHGMWRVLGYQKEADTEIAGGR